MINEIGNKLEKEYDFKYLYSDFKKKEGINLIELTMENRDQIPFKIVDMIINK